jgi:hypothetical protein
MAGIAMLMEPPDPDSVNTLADFTEYLDHLSQHFRREGNGDDWQHWLIGDYLDAIAAWLREGPPNLPEAVEERAREIEQDKPSWRGVAILFDAGRVYE